MSEKKLWTSRDFFIQCAYLFGSLAQSVERRPFKAMVAGSIPAGPTIDRNIHTASWCFFAGSQ